MYKNLVFVFLILLSIAILACGIWQYQQFYDWLEPRHIEGITLMVLIGFGLTAMFVPVVVRQDWAESSVRDVAMHYLAAFGIMFSALTVVFFALWLFGWFYLYLYTYPILLVAVLLVLGVIGYILNQKSRQKQ